MLLFGGMATLVIGATLAIFFAQSAGLGASGVGRAIVAVDNGSGVKGFKEDAVFIAVSGPITFLGDYKSTTPILKLDRWTYSKTGLKIDCEALQIDALDLTGKTVASGPAMAGGEAGTCSYALRVPGTARTLTVSQPGAAAVYILTDEQKSAGVAKMDPKGYKFDPAALKWSVAGSLKLDTAQKSAGSLSVGLSQTVPLAVRIAP